MEVFNARDLVNTKKAQLLQVLPDKLTVVFEDGVQIETTKRKILYSRFFWKAHSFYPKTPILSRHFVDHVLKGKLLHSRTHTDLLSIIIEDTVNAYGLHKPEQKEHLLELVYEITNDIHNEVTKYAEQDVMSIDILDFINVIEHPVIKEANNRAIATRESIAQTYATVSNVIHTDESLKNNSLVKAIKSKMVNENQVAQCVAVRGFPTEVDGSILPVPILSNFTKGLLKLYDFIAESRSAAKSLYFSEAPLQDAEYFSRRLQLLTMTVERIHHEDCGSTTYLEWRVNPPVKDENGKIVYQGDLNFMVGKYYLDETSNTLKEITHNDPAMWNTVLKLRSSIYCKHPDSHGVCSVCFGKLSENVSRFANLGHLVSATLTEQTSQSVLSTKHLDGSAVSSGIILTELTGKYFTTNKAKNCYILKKEFKDRNIKLIVNRDEAIGLVDIFNIDSIDNINPIRISSVECIELKYMETPEEEISMPLYINQGNRCAIMTIEFLKYLKHHRWETDSRNNFLFNLQDWDFSLPIFKLIEVEYSFSDHSHQVATLIESSMKNITDRLKPDSPVSTLQELFRLVNTKLNVNIAALEVMVYSIMSDGRDDYKLARNVDAPVLGVADRIIKNRSLGPAYAYEDQFDTIIDPKSFMKLNRPDSIFDVFIAPQEVVDTYKH